MLRSAAALLSAIGLAGYSYAQSVVFEEEPNDDPLTIEKEISGEARLRGKAVGGDQDGIWWVIGEKEAERFWDIELRARTEGLIEMDVIQLVSEEATLEQAGQEEGFTGRRDLLNLTTREGQPVETASRLMVPQGRYLIGVSNGGGGGEYEVVLRDAGPAASWGNIEANDDGGAEKLEFPDDARRVYRLLGKRHEINLDIPEPSDEAPDKQLWRVDVTGEVGTELEAWVENEAGEVVGPRQTGNPLNRHWGRLALEMGATLHLESTNAKAVGRVEIGLRGDGRAIGNKEVEPNQTVANANWLQAGQGLSATINGASDTDVYVFSVDADQETTLDLSVAAEGNEPVDVCLAPVDESRPEICREAGGGKGTPLFAGMVLRDGDYRVSVDSHTAGTFGYEIGLEEKAAPSATAAREPTDAPEWASPLTDRPVRGTFGADRTAWFEMDATGAPQLWRFQANGDAIKGLEIRRAASGETIAETSYSGDGESIKRIGSVRLLPGRYHVGVNGQQGDYLLRAISLGPPEPGYEIEPNDNSNTAQRLSQAEASMRGVSSDDEDVDSYAFTVPGMTRARVTLEPPDDGEARIDIMWGEDQLFHSGMHAEKQVYELLLPPGDYRAEVRGESETAQEYAVDIQTLSPWANYEGAIAAFSQAKAMPLDGGDIGEGLSTAGGESWLRLPVSGKARDITVGLTGETGYHHVTLVNAQGKELVDTENDPFTETIPADEEWFLYLTGHQNFSGRMTLEDPARDSATGEGLELSLEADAESLAAWSKAHQRLNAELTVENGTEGALEVPVTFAVSHEGAQIDAGAETVSVPAGETEKVSVSVTLPSELAEGSPVILHARAGPASGLRTSLWTGSILDTRAGAAHAETKVSVEAGVVPSKPDYRPIVPEDLAGLPDLAWAGHGARFVDSETGDLREPDTSATGSVDHLNNGFSNSDDGLEWEGDAGKALPALKLAGRGGDIHAIVFNSRSHLSYLARWHRVDVQVSQDGETYETVLEATLSPSDGLQVFRLDEPVPATHVRLVPESTWGEWPYESGIGSINVIGKPAADDPAFGQRDLLRPDAGGHVVYASDYPDSYQDTVYYRENETVRTVRGFRNHRLARLGSLAWHDSSGSGGGKKPKSARVYTSRAGAAGPWTEEGRLDLTDMSDGTARLEFSEPVEARYIRLDWTIPETGDYYPPRLSAVEANTVASGESILGYWGNYAMTGPRAVQGDPLEGMASGELDTTSNPEDPRPLDGPVRGRVDQPGKARAYTVSLGEQENALDVTLSEASRGRLEVSVTGPHGTTHPLEWTASSEVTRTGRATGLPPGKYRIDVREPKRSVVLVWDNSGSVSHHRPAIERAMTDLAEGIRPGEEVANVIVMGGGPLVDGWATDTSQVYQAITEDPGSATSSQAEAGLHEANKILGEQPGQRVVILIADAEIGSSRNDKLWPGMRGVKPRVYSIGLDTGAGTTTEKLRTERNLLQSWAQVNGGDYSYNTGRADLLRSFNKAMIDMRRPAEFVIDASKTYVEPPEPGRLSVVSRDEPVAGAGAVHVIFDASGSMLQAMDKGRRIEVARSMMRDVVAERIPGGVPVALRVFGHTEPDSCETELIVAPEADNQDDVLEAVRGIEAVNLARTALADSLTAVSQDMSGFDEDRQLVVMFTDGEETCDGDVEAAVRKLSESGVELRLNIVGLRIDEKDLRERFEQIADIGGGEYFDSQDGAELQDSLAAATAARYRVFDTGGAIAAEGRVDGGGVKLDPGAYEVVVELADGEHSETVEIKADASTEVSL